MLTACERGQRTESGTDSLESSSASATTAAEDAAASPEETLPDPDSAEGMKRALGRTCLNDAACPGYLRCIERACTTPPAITGEHDAQTPAVVFTDEDGEEVARYWVEVAATNAERMRGLMFRRSMKSDWGMLFVYPDERPRRFWMKNTYIPLDMIFIDGRGQVVGIVEGAEPLVEDPRGVDAPARYVLELKAGTARDDGITSGAHMELLRAPKDEFKPYR